MKPREAFGPADVGSETLSREGSPTAFDLGGLGAGGAGAADVSTDPRLLRPRWSHTSALDESGGEALAQLEPPKGEVVSERLAKELTSDWRLLADRLGRLLLTDEDREAVGAAPAPLVLRLKLPRGFLDALPWELVRLPGEESEGVGRSPRRRSLARVTEDRPGEDSHSVRFVQWALPRTGAPSMPVDGLIGPLTRRTIADFQKRQGLAPTERIDTDLIEALVQRLRSEPARGRVLVVQPAISADQETTYIKRGGDSLEQIYASAGAKVFPVYGGNPEEIAQALERFEPNLIHLVATVRESRSRGLVVLDFVRGREAASGPQLTAPNLDSIVKGVRSARPRPFLVLDIARPSSTFEGAMALGMRNLFAAELQRLRTFSGILASGLEQPQMLGTLARTVAGTVAGGGSMGRLGMDVRALFGEASAPSSPVSELDLVLAYLGAALFTENPNLPVAYG